MRIALTLALHLCSLSYGCALFPTDHYTQHLGCPYDIVWNAASETMKIFPTPVEDKEKGIIETGWTEIEGDERGYGVFRRTKTGFGNRERIRMIMKVNRANDLTEVVVIENRQRWHLKGGASSSATRWWPIDPSEEYMADVMIRLNNKLGEQGCPPS